MPQNGVSDTITHVTINTINCVVQYDVGQVLKDVIEFINSIINIWDRF